MERERVDLSLLTAEQRKQYESYQIGFTSEFWESLMARVADVYDALARQYENAAGEQSLGRIQGARQSLAWFAALPTAVENEFLVLTGQIGGGADIEAPPEAGNWAA